MEHVEFAVEARSQKDSNVWNIVGFDTTFTEYKHAKGYMDMRKDMFPSVEYRIVSRKITDWEPAVEEN